MVDPEIEELVLRITSTQRFDQSEVTYTRGKAVVKLTGRLPPRCYTVTISEDDTEKKMAAIEKEELIFHKLMEATKSVRYRMKVGGARTFPLTDPECQQGVRDQDGCFTLYSGPSRVYQVRVLSDTLGGITRTA